MSQPKYDFVFLHSSPLAINSVPLPQLNYREELKQIKNALLESGKALRMTSKVATTNTFSALRTMGCRIVHFSGHGCPTTGCLHFEKSSGGDSAPIQPAKLADLFSPSGNSNINKDTNKIQLVFLSTCFSEMAGKALTKVVKHVIAIEKNTKIKDEDGCLFAFQLYLALFTGKSVRESFDIACSVIAANSAITSRPFVLLPENDPIHNETLPSHMLTDTDYASNSSNSLIDESARVGSVFYNCPIPRNNKEFLGRIQPLLDIVNYFHHGKSNIVTIRGGTSVGKTELALQAVQYMNERNYFKHIVFVPFGKFLPPSMDVQRNYVNSGSSKVMSGVLNEEDALDDGEDEFSILDRKAILKYFCKFLPPEFTVSGVDSVINHLELGSTSSTAENNEYRNPFLFVFDGCDHLIDCPKKRSDMSTGSLTKPPTGDNNTSTCPTSTVVEDNASKEATTGALISGMNNNLDSSSGISANTTQLPPSPPPNAWNKPLSMLSHHPIDQLNPRVLQKNRSPLHKFIDGLLKQRRDIYFLVTSSVPIVPPSKYISNNSEKVVSIGRLSDDIMANIVNILAPRALKLEELDIAPTTKVADMIKKFASNKAIQALKGNPGALVRFVSHLNYSTIDKAVDIAKESFILSEQASIKRHPLPVESTVEDTEVPVQVQDKSSLLSTSTSVTDSITHTSKVEEGTTIINASNSALNGELNDELDNSKNIDESEANPVKKEIVGIDQDSRTTAVLVDKIKEMCVNNKNNIVKPNNPTKVDVIQVPQTETVKVLGGRGVVYMSGLDVNYEEALRKAKEVAEIYIHDIMCVNIWAELTANCDISGGSLKKGGHMELKPRSTVLFTDLITKMNEKMTLFLEENSFSNPKTRNSFVCSGTLVENKQLNVPEMYKFISETSTIKSLLDSSLGGRTNAMTANTIGSSSSSSYANVTNSEPRSILPENTTISLRRFAEFSKWWSPLLSSLSRLKQEFYTTCRISKASMSPTGISTTDTKLNPLILGFISNSEATKKLLAIRPMVEGVFIIRFSSQPGALAVSFTEYKKSTTSSTTSRHVVVTHCLAEVLENGELDLIISMKEATHQSKAYRCKSLRDMIMKCNKLKYFYPSIVCKENIYGGTKKPHSK